MLSCTKVSDTGICLKCKSKTIIINAFYRKPDLTNPDTNSYNESLSYDKNGNITALQRTGEFDDSYYNLTIDNLTYSYNSVNPNQLDKVDDATNNPNGFKDGTNTGKDYTYDDYGNMKTDGNKTIYQILYNHLNLPTNIDFSQGKISYLYNAVGVKLMKNVLSTNPTLTTDYLDGFQYLNSVLEFFPHAEGYVKNTIYRGANAYNYVFNYTDHLGNIRLSYGAGLGNALTIFEENNYYPFGLSHKNYNMDQRTYNGLGQTVTVCSSCPTGYKYKFNGKELQDELGLNVYDYDNRVYDQAMGRFWQIDPLAENGRRWSPYNYCFDNPVYFQDPDGMWPWPSWSTIKNKAQNLVKDVTRAVIAKTYTLAKDYVTTKSKEIINAITPEIKRTKPEKAQKADGFGISFTTEGGKKGGMTTPQGDRKVKQMDMTVINGLTEVYGPQTTVPGVTPDGSNPFVQNSSENSAPSEKSSSTLENNEKTEISIPKTNFDGSTNSKSATMYFKDTTVNKVDSAKVTNEAKNKQKKDTQNFNKKYGTDF